MLQPSSSGALGEQILQIPPGDRWRIYYRLQELMINCWCPADGSLRVQINSCLQAILVRSIVLQHIANRSQLVDWLERCWQLSD